MRYSTDDLIKMLNEGIEIGFYYEGVKLCFGPINDKGEKK